MLVLNLMVMQFDVLFNTQDDSAHTDSLEVVKAMEQVSYDIQN